MKLFREVRLNKYIIIFLIIILSIFFVDNMRIQSLQNEQFYRIYLCNVIDNAMVDAANSINVTGDRYREISVSGINPYEVLTKFFESIAFSLGYNHEDINEFKNYIPFILLMDGDGFYIYKLDEFNYSAEIAHRLYPKEYFSYMDGDAMYGFDVDFNIDIYDKSDKSLVLSVNAKNVQEVERYGEHYELLREPKLIEKMKLLMYQQLEDSLNEAMNSHHSLAAKKGIFYGFEWNYDVEKFDIFNQKNAMAILIQGLPMMGNTTFEYVAFNRFEVTRGEFVYGFIRDGIRYRSKRHPEEMGYELIEIFSNDREAARAGYYLYDED